MGSDRLIFEIFHRLKMIDGRRAVIVLPDERQLEILVQPRLTGADLTDIASSHAGVREKEYFGLAYVDDTGHYTWLQHDRRVLDHEFPKKPPPMVIGSLYPDKSKHVVLYFLVKFYVESITSLRDSHTVEQFYLQARSLIFKGQLDVDSESAFSLAAWALQASYGDFDESSAKNYLKKLPLLPPSVLKESPSLAYCEERVLGIYRSLLGQSRGKSIVNYMTLVESLPNYGVHFFQVKDKRNLAWWLGISYKGIAQYDHSDRRKPRRVFQWKQLENLYFRDRKFSVEVHDPKRVVHAVSSVNLYEEQPEDQTDDLSAAIADSHTQVSTSRRTFHPGVISVAVWFAQSQALTKNIWQMAIAQHQFFLDRKQCKGKQPINRNLVEVALDLSKSSTSLSTTSSHSNLSRSGSASSITGKMGHAPIECEESEASKAARLEMLAALKARKEALEEKLKARTAELKKFCIQEAELTGVLPPEIPLSPGEPAPQIRRRIGTGFALSEILLNNAKSSQDESLDALELEYEIQRKITSAAHKLASDSTASKAVRRQRKTVYQQSLHRLKEFECRLRALRLAESYGACQAQPQVPILPLTKQKKKPRPLDDDGGFLKAEEESSIINDSFVSMSDTSGVNLSPAPPAANYSTYSSSIPSSPGKSRPEAPPATAQMATLRHPEGSGYIPRCGLTRNSYRAKQYPTFSTRLSAPDPRQEQCGLPGWEGQQLHGSRVPATALCPPMVGVDPSAGIGLYNVPRQRASHDFPCNQAGQAPNDTEIAAGLRRLTSGGDLMPSRDPDFEWDFGGANEDEPDTPVGLRPQANGRFGSLDRRRYGMRPNGGGNDALNHSITESLNSVPSNHPHLSSTSSNSVDVIDGSSIGPRYGNRFPKSHSHHDTLLPSQTYPDHVGVAMRYVTSSQGHSVSHSHLPQSHPAHGSNRRSTSVSKIETVFDVNQEVVTHVTAAGSLSNVSMKKGRDWYETSLDSPVLPNKNESFSPRSSVNRSRSSSVSENKSTTSTEHNNNVSVEHSVSASHTAHAQPARVSQESEKQHDSSFEAKEIPFENPQNFTLISAGTWVPYREVTKPFETSDIYKYSARFRKQSQSSLKENDLAENLGTSKGVYQPLAPQVAMAPGQQQHLRYAKRIPSSLNGSFSSEDTGNSNSSSYNKAGMAHAQDKHWYDMEEAPKPKPATLV